MQHLEQGQAVSLMQYPILGDSGGLTAGLGYL